MMADKNRRPTTSPIDNSSYQTRYAPTTETDVFYPESDGKPMAETEIHRDAIMDALQTLSEYFKDDPDVCVSGNLMMYYVKGNSRKSISPDVFVTFGVCKKLRRTYKIWEEGKQPDFVLEFSSEKTYRKDLLDKKELYAKIGIVEYFLYDAERRYLSSPLMGYRFVDGVYVSIKPTVDGYLYSETLEVELGLRDEGLGFYDPVLEKWLETSAEVASARAEREAAARQQAEAEIVQLREEINRLKSQSVQSGSNLE